MSSMELADAIHVNRMTITKYLNILSAIGLIKRKKIGSINIWTIESGVEDIEFPLNYLHLQQKFINSLVGYNKRELGKILIEIYHKNTEYNKNIHNIFIAGNQDQILNSKILSVASEVSNCDTIYIGNIEQHIDPFFDIDLQRHIANFWLHKKGTKVIFLCCSEEGSLRFLSTAADYIKMKMAENIKIVLFVNSEILDLA